MLGNILIRKFFRHAVSCAASPLAALRKRTGYSIKKCKEALTLYENDIDAAEKWLDEIGQKEGWAKAEEMKHRSTLQGLVGVCVRANAAALVEVNCETDFVARNERFISLTSQVTQRCLELAESQEASDPHFSKVSLDGKRIQSLETSSGKTLGELVAMAISHMKENMSIRRATLFRTDSGNQLHSTTHPAYCGESPVAVGKYAAVVAVRSESPVVPLQVCQHIIGMNPKELGNTEEEEEESSTSSDSDEEVKKTKEEEKRLLQQEFLLDQDITVKTFLKDKQCKVLGFQRYECGEILEI